MRVVFDTNVLVSALLFEDSIPAHALFAAIEAGKFLLSEALVNEINEILQRKNLNATFPLSSAKSF